MDAMHTPNNVEMQLTAKVRGFIFDLSKSEM